ncbi:MAG: polysaccharide deacetylase family protein [Candidatus Eisenbacteria bacterium]|nr:polysaccharide deacetylase family protein [Candidatus Eisenbacteria bacterium]
MESGDQKLVVAWDCEDTAGVAFFRIRVSDTSGIYRDMPDWNGREAAFTFTTDDGRRDNLGWAEVCRALGVSATFFCVPDYVGDPGFLSADEIRRIDSLAIEIGCHSMSHVALLTDEAFHMRYEGPAPSCSLRIWGGRLQTFLEPDSLDLDIDLNAAGTNFLHSLCATIRNHPCYDCSLDFYTCADDFCRAHYLEWVRGVPIGRDWHQTYTTKGIDSLRLDLETAGAKAFLEALVSRPDYECRSFAYPMHLHGEREIAACVRAGFFGARDGYAYPRPWGSPNGPDDLFNVNVYEKLSVSAPFSNGWDEAATRDWVRGLVRDWKANKRWATLRVAHTYADIDSAHLFWVLDEIAADGGVWIGAFGDVAEYARRYAISIGKPPRLEATLAGLMPDRIHYAVITALDEDRNESARSNEIAFIVSSSIGVRGTDRLAEPGARPIRFLGSSPVVEGGGASIWFSLEEPLVLEVSIYDVSGRAVVRRRTERLEPGSRSILWDGRSSAGREVAAGRYLVLLRGESGEDCGSVLLVR